MSIGNTKSHQWNKWCRHRNYEKQKYQSKGVHSIEIQKTGNQEHQRFLRRMQEKTKTIGTQTKKTKFTRLWLHRW